MARKTKEDVGEDLVKLKSPVKKTEPVIEEKTTPKVVKEEVVEKDTPFTKMGVEDFAFTTSEALSTLAVTDFTAVDGQEEVVLSWTTPEDATLSAVQLNYAVGSDAPSGYDDGTLLFSTGSAIETYTHTSLSANQVYAYSVFTQDVSGEWTTLTEDTSATATPYLRVTDLTATAGQKRVNLAWTTPDSENLSAVLVAFDIDTPPSAYDVGTQVYSGVASTVEHTGLSADQVYAYSIFTVDSNLGTWSTLVAGGTAVATPFATTAYGTTAFPYHTDAQIRAIFLEEGII